MTHMTHMPQGTEGDYAPDVFDWLAGDGFVMIGEVISKRAKINTKTVDISVSGVIPKTAADPMPHGTTITLGWFTPGLFGPVKDSA